MFATDTAPWSSRPHHHTPYLPRLARLDVLDHGQKPTPCSLHHRHVPVSYSGSTDSSSPRSPDPTRARREPKKNVSRERMRSELLALRVQASCLETELAYLQQLRLERSAASRGVDEADDDDSRIRNHSDPPAPANGWRAMAERQRARRLRAEMQNQQLRSFVAAQRSEWQTLQTLFDAKSSALVGRIASVRGVEATASGTTRAPVFFSVMM